MTKEYDVIVIGAGTAGLSAISEIKKQTDNFLVIDHGPLGTTCARVGCMPSKALLQIGKDFHRAKILSNCGVRGIEHLLPDTEEVLKYVRLHRDRLVSSVIQGMRKWSEKHLICGQARFQDTNTIALVDGPCFRAKKFVLATGTKPIIPSRWIEFSSHIITTDTLFEQQKLPNKLGLVGMGNIGLEIGQTLKRLGIDVVGIDIQNNLGGLTDPELKRLAMEIYSQEIPLSLEGINKIEFDKDDNLDVHYNSKVKNVEKLLLTMGRQSTLKDLGLEEIGVPFNENNLPAINRETFQIRGYPYFAIGDCNKMDEVLHEASDEGHIAGYNVFQENPKCFKRRTQLKITFSDPNMAVVGKSFQQLQNENTDFIVGSINYQQQGRATLMGDNRGKAKLYAARKDGTLLGAEIIAPDGEHLAHSLAWLISCNRKVENTLEMPFYHPTLEEGLRTAIRNLAVQLEYPNAELMRCEEVPVKFSPKYNTT